jgi:S1-C subfamily serine protease
LPQRKGRRRVAAAASKTVASIRRGAVAIVAVALVAGCGEDAITPSPPDWRVIYRRAAPAVVAVAAVSRYRGLPAADPGGHPRNLRHVESGSAFSIGSGLLVTNFHVVRGATSIRLSLANGSDVRARVVDIDASSDIAVLRPTRASSLPTLQFGNSRRVGVGDPVAAIGNPPRLASSLTVGVVSGLHRTLNGGGLHVVDGIPNRRRHQPR